MMVLVGNLDVVPCLVKRVTIVFCSLNLAVELRFFIAVKAKRVCDM